MQKLQTTIKYFDQVELFGFFHWAFYYFTKYVKDISAYTQEEIQIKNTVLKTIAHTIKTHFLDGKKHEVDVVMNTIYLETKKQDLDALSSINEFQLLEKKI